MILLAPVGSHLLVAVGCARMVSFLKQQFYVVCVIRGICFFYFNMRVSNFEYGALFWLLVAGSVHAQEPIEGQVPMGFKLNGTSDCDDAVGFET